ncbi:uncharacterized protein LOC126620980 [Malus sylvestris]|uniref:uncharacterized protein LOC126620980 n=1 Tax=Malus sylvestris TaxID=3752 RepID=UPI0021AC1DA3|nr:uncharacterized protein LOC126620980 [Malus sylvestris]
MVACLKKRVGLLSSEREMASFCRSALMARALTLTSLNSLNPAAMASPFASATRTVPCATSSSVTRTPCSGHFKLSTKLACILVPPSFVLFPFPLLSGNCIVVFSTEAEREPCPGSTKLYCTTLLLPCVPMAYKLLFVKRFP